MLKTAFFLALAVCHILASGVEVAPSAPLVAPVATGVVTARSSQYVAQNYNALAPLTAPLQPVAAVAPVAQYVAPSSASVSQVTRYAQYVAPAVTQYVAPAVAQYVSPAVTQYASPIVAQYASAAITQYASPTVTQYVSPAVAQYVAAPTPLAAAPLVARPILAPLVARAPLPPVAVAPQHPQQPPSGNPAFQAPNPDSETVEVESARVRALPQRNQAAEQPAGVSARGFLNFAQGPQNLAEFQQQVRIQNENSQAAQRGSQPLGRNQAQEQQRSAAPGLLSSQQFIQGPYLG